MSNNGNTVKVSLYHVWCILVTCMIMQVLFIMIIYHQQEHINILQKQINNIEKYNSINIDEKMKAFINNDNKDNNNNSNNKNKDNNKNSNNNNNKLVDERFQRTPLCTKKLKRYKLHCLEKDTFTLVMTVFSRPHFTSQLKHVMENTWLPKKIIVFQTYDIAKYTEPKHYKKYLNSTKYPPIYFIRSEYDFKFHGRFLFPLMFDTEYTMVIDDDLWVGKKWFEHNLRVSKENGRALVGGMGRNVLSVSSYNHRSGLTQKFVCDFGCNETSHVDFGGHTWFFPTNYVRYFWRLAPSTFHTGEDMHFGAALQMFNVAKVVTPSQERKDGGATKHDLKNGHLARVTNSNDVNKKILPHSSRKPYYFHRRNAVCILLKKGWKPKGCFNCSANIVDNECMPSLDMNDMKEEYSRI